MLWNLADIEMLIATGSKAHISRWHNFYYDNTKTQNTVGDLFRVNKLFGLRTLESEDLNLKVHTLMFSAAILLFYPTFSFYYFVLFQFRQ